MSYRANPNLDLHILPHRDQGHGPRSQRNNGEDASVLIDATLKEDFPPISLPKREYMERAREIWQELGLPPLKPEAPWYGYSLGDWPEELDQAAQLAVKGEYFQPGEKVVQRRRKDVPLGGHGLGSWAQVAHPPVAADIESRGRRLPPLGEAALRKRRRPRIEAMRAEVERAGEETLEIVAELGPILGHRSIFRAN